MKDLEKEQLRIVVLTESFALKFLDPATVKGVLKQTIRNRDSATPGFIENVTKMTSLLATLSNENDRSGEPEIIKRETKLAMEVIQQIVTSLAITVNDLNSVFENQPLVTINSILQALCFELHPANIEKRAFKPEQIEFDGVHDKFLDILMRRIDLKLEEIQSDDQIKESYFAVRQEITMTVTSLKKYIYFAAAINKAKVGDQQANTKFWKQQSPIVLVIYDRLQRLVLMRWDMLLFSQRVQLMFEFCQKGLMQPWFMNDNQVMKFIDDVDMAALAERNIIDFVNFGHILAS